MSGRGPQAEPADDQEMLFPCQGCGRASADLRPWSQEERVRALARGGDRPAGAPVFHDTVRTRVYQVCPTCALRLAEGGDIHRLRARRTGVQILLFCLALALIAVLTPILLPYVLSALWLK